jgi:hypothetical protein
MTTHSEAELILVAALERLEKWGRAWDFRAAEDIACEALEAYRKASTTPPIADGGEAVAKPYRDVAQVMQHMHNIFANGSSADWSMVGDWFHELHRLGAGTPAPTDAISGGVAGELIIAAMDHLPTDRAPSRHELIRAFTLALNASNTDAYGGGVPEGYVLVPVEPTEAMLEATSKVVAGTLVSKSIRVAIYKAMLNASASTREGGSD